LRKLFGWKLVGWLADWKLAEVGSPVVFFYRNLIVNNIWMEVF